MKSKVTFGLVFVCFLSLISSESWARETNSPRMLFEQAQSLADRRQNEEALQKYLELFEVAPFAYPSAFYRATLLALEVQDCEKALLLSEGYQKMVHEGRPLPSELTECGNKLNRAQLKIGVKPIVKVDVFVDDIFVDRIKKRAQLAIPVGNRNIKVSATGYEVEQTNVELEAGDQANVRFQLEKRSDSGELMVRVNQKNARIRIEPRGLQNDALPIKPIVRESPLERPLELPAGDYLMEITKNGYDRWIRRFKLEEQQKKSLEVQMQSIRTEPLFR